MRRFNVSQAVEIEANREDPFRDPSDIYERMRARMFRLFGHAPWVEDVLQSAFETFLRKRHTWRGEGSLEAFADAIALNAARDEMRRQRRRNVVYGLVAVRGEWPVLPPGPVEQVEDRDRVRRLQIVLERLRPLYRIPYLLYHVENRTVPEIARIEGASEDAIRKRITRARNEIRRRARRDPVLAEWLEAIEESG